MNYKVIPFIAQINHKDSTDAVAKQLQNLINDYSAQGWEYVRLENVETSVEGDNGCFGIGAKPGYNTSCMVAVFKR